MAGFGFGEMPTVGTPHEEPGAAGRAGDVDLDGGAIGSGDRSVGPRERAHESFEDREVELADHDFGGDGASGWSDSDADLLLMVPALGVLPGDVEPVERFGFAGPGDGEKSFGKRVQRGKVVARFPAGHLHPFDEHAGADAPRGPHPVGIQLVEKFYEAVIGLGIFRVLTKKSVATHGEVADVRVEEMRGEVFDGPSRADGGLLPVVRGERPQKREELSFNLREEMRDEDRLRLSHERSILPNFAAD